MDRALICCILSKVRLNSITKNGAMAQLVAHLHGMEGVGGSNPPSSTIYLGRLHNLPRFFFILFSPRRNSVCLSLSSTNNEHHRPEVALNKSSKYELGKALITYKRGERRSLLLISKGSELGLGLINQVLSQRFRHSLRSAIDTHAVACFASETT